MVRESLAADGELRPDKSVHELTVDKNVLIAHFGADDVRSLRVAVSSFFDYAAVAVRTLQEFSTLAGDVSGDVEAFGAMEPADAASGRLQG